MMHLPLVLPEKNKHFPSLNNNNNNSIREILLCPMHLLSLKAQMSINLPTTHPQRKRPVEENILFPHA
jgi:hypothetical protein